MPTPYDSEEFQERLYWRERTNNQLLRVSNCIASWTDICGFGSLLEKSGWDLNALQDVGLVRLLEQVHSIAGRPMLVNVDPLPNDKIIVLNDGAARTIDLTHKDKVHGFSFLVFLRDLICSHFLLLSVTKVYKVGVRTILAGGERIQYSSASITGHSSLYYDEEKISDYGKKLLQTTFVYNPAEFQMNTAFAKAFTIDSFGTKKNINVNGFYIEKSFLDKIDGIQDVNFELIPSSIKVYHKEVLVFELSIRDTIMLDLKGLNVTVFYIDKYFIHKDFDGDDLEFDLFNQTD